MPVHKNSLKNLKSTKKGQVLNPKGKPKGTKDLKTIFKEFSEIKTPSKHPDSAKRLTALEVVVLKQFQKAMKGDNVSAKEIFDRMVGKAHQTNDVTINEYTVDIHNDED